MLYAKETKFNLLENSYKKSRYIISSYSLSKHEKKYNKLIGKCITLPSLSPNHFFFSLKNTGSMIQPRPRKYPEDYESRRASSRGLIPRAKVKTIKMTFVIVFGT